MKTRPDPVTASLRATIVRGLPSVLSTCTALLLVAGQSRASVWANAASGGLWSDNSASGWNSTGVPDSNTATADFSTLDLTADNTVHLDGSFQVNQLLFADASTASHNWILDNNGSAANVLTLSGSAPSIAVSNQTATISAQLATTSGFAKTGTGTLVLANDATDAQLAAGTSVTGTLQQDAGKLTGAGTLTIATLTAAGTVTLNNGSYLLVTAANADLFVGASGDNRGLLGRLNVNGTADLQVARDLRVGGDNASANNRSAGRMDVTGGAVSVGRNLDVRMSGDNNSGTGILNVSGGSVTADKLYVRNERQKAANVSVTISATGVLTATNGVVFTAIQNGNVNTTSTLTLSGGGTLRTKSITGAADTTNARPVLALTNGTIVALADNPAFLPAASFTNPPVLGTTGITFNTNGFNIGIAQVLAGIGGKLTKSGTGTLQLFANNTFSGQVTVRDGILDVRHANALGDAAKTVLVSGSAQNPELQIQGGLAITLGNLKTSGDGSGAASGVLRSVAGNNSITVTGTTTLTGGNGSSWWQCDADTFTLNSSVTTDMADRVLTLRGAGHGIINGIISNGTTVNLPVVKEGSGTWTLDNGANSYSGNTTVKAGTLKLGAAASISASPVVDVQSGATLNVTALAAGLPLAAAQTLKGNGTLAGKLAAGSGTVAPGTSSTGNLTVSGDAVLTGSTLAVEIDDSKSPKCDTLAVTGALDIAGSSLDLAVTGAPANPVYVIATYGTLNGTFATITPGVPAGYTLDYAYQGNKIALLGGTPPSSFAAWIGKPEFALAVADQDPGDDPDVDGDPNLLEFALNSNPAKGAGKAKVWVKMATVGGTPNVLTLTIAARAGANFAADGNTSKAVVAADGLTYVIEAGNTLNADWGGTVATSEVTGSDATAIQAAAPFTADDGWVLKTFRTDGSAPADPSDFIRVRLTTP